MHNIYSLDPVAIGQMCDMDSPVYLCPLLPQMFIVTYIICVTMVHLIP